MGTEAATSPWVCIDCQSIREKPEKRMPAGWKRHGDLVYCDSCWRKRYLLRAVSVPVASPLDQSWPELIAVIREMCGTTTQACNWMVTEMYARDVRRNGQSSLPPMPQMYLYPEARAMFPQLPSSSLAALERAVKSTYRAKRYEVLWTCAASLPTYRYPTPLPCPTQSWSIDMELDVPVVSVRLGDSRVRLRLKGGPRYRRQLVAIRNLVSGAAVQGQMDIYQRGADILCKMVSWLPRDPSHDKREKNGRLSVMSHSKGMIIAVDPKGQQLWMFHGDQISRWSAEHRCQLQRWADDSKAELRPDVPFQRRREDATRKYRNRMESSSHQIAAMIAGFAQRRKFASVQYNDTDQSFCAGFPWSKLRELVKQKCDAIGVLFEHTNANGMTTQPDSPAISEEKGIE